MRASRLHTTLSAPEAWARASKVTTPTTGMPAPNAMPCATPHATRRPVNAPGPDPNATPSSPLAVRPCAANNASTIGSSTSELRCPASASRASTLPSDHNATEHKSVELSSARIFNMGNRMAKADFTRQAQCRPLPVDRFGAACNRGRRELRWCVRRYRVYHCDFENGGRPSRQAGLALAS